MWEQSLCESGPHRHARSWASLLASASGQTLLIAAAVILPLFRAVWMPHFEPPIPLAAPVVPPVAVRAVPPVRAPQHSWHVLSLATLAPLIYMPAPRTVAAAPPAAMSAPATLTPVGTAEPELAILGPPAVTAPLAPAPVPGAPVLRGGELEAALCLACPPPLYPAVARQARIEGTVVLRAVITPDGRIAGLQIVAGNAILAAAAMRAVRAWRYRPLVLDGHDVTVACDITVHFRLE